MREFKLSVADALIGGTAITEDLFLMSVDRAFMRVDRGLKLIRPT